MTIHTITRLDHLQRGTRRLRSAFWFIVGALLFCAGTGAYWTYLADVPHDYDNIEDHFKYGSIGSDLGAGIPYWIWQVLPDVFPDFLPDPNAWNAESFDNRRAVRAYEQFGFVAEEGHKLPIGFSTRRLNLERIGLNCAVCHVSTIRVTSGMIPDQIYGRSPAYTSPGHARAIILGMPANTVDLGAYLNFLNQCALDETRFNTSNILAAIKRRHYLNPIDEAIYARAIPMTRQGILDQVADFQFLRSNPPAGPGRVDTFNPYKTHVFKFPFDDTVGTSDFPSIWNQRPRDGLSLHWDGNNSSVFERNISASFGAGATPVTIDLARMNRVGYWLGASTPGEDVAPQSAKRQYEFQPRANEMQIPRFPFAIDHALASRGSAVFSHLCASCHDWPSGPGDASAEPPGKYLGQVVPLDRIGTDPERVISYTYALAANQNTLGAGAAWRFSHFRKTNGYVNMPLDGIWARAPYLHNGSVPTLAALLNLSERPAKFYRGDDVYDPVSVGFRTSNSRSEDGRNLFEFDTSLRGNSSGGHVGKVYGTELSDEEKKALIEYLKTL